MSDQFELYAEVRDDMGKGASRRLRRHAEKVPAIVYGGEKAPKAVSLIRKDLEKALENEAFFSHVLTLKVGNDVEKAILKDLQRHPAKGFLMHADFQRVNENVAIKVHVPIHFLNEESCHGVKMQGGMIQHQETDIEVSCLPKDIPEYIEVDMAAVKSGEIVHLTDVKLPAGVTAVALTLGEDHDLAIASVVPPKGGAGDDSSEASDEDESSSDSSED
ncbi:50S ribosomal protein L25/general stress protein Ctc [Haliea atlantica]|nr:50S ribosomal protein L25/general stress protein Ctc [Haliea sp.]MAL95890.1 50S ribosomal protein L25/general stress protein Ctc [Haliea sp.]|tara:strand:+ start:1110 stop:1763 length:654 start_codon:yes stop_codon:yes gene_type:complete